MASIQSIAHDLALIRKQRPLILNITNFVAMDFSANTLLAVGASPIMSLEISEIDELVQAASAVVINMGTMNSAWLDLAETAWSKAIEYEKPVIFDPVGAGGTTLRSSVARTFIAKHKVNVVRGNASEILALFSEERTGKGVDSGLTSERVASLIREKIPVNEVAFVISGSTDFVMADKKSYWVKNGHPLMASVTAMGCVATCLIAAFRAVNCSNSSAALNAMAFVGLCGEIAAKKSQGPGSLRTRFIDLLSSDPVDFDVSVKAGVLI